MLFNIQRALLPLRLADRRAAGGGRGGGRCLQRRDGPPGRPGRCPSPAVDRPLRLGRAPGGHEHHPIQRWTFAGALVLVEIAGGCIDTAMNAEATHRLIGNPAALVRFHALFNCGALVGAAVAGIVIHAGVSWRWIWPAIAVHAALASLGIWSWLTDRRHAHGSKPDRRRPHPGAVHPLRRLHGRRVCWCCWPSSPWPRSPRGASTPGASCSCATTWLAASCWAPAPTWWGRPWPPPPGQPGGPCSVACRLAGP